MKRIKEIEDYPLQLKEFIYDVFRETLKIIGRDNLVSIVFLGSAARGELSYKFTDEQLDVYSDIEFVVVVKKHVPEETNEKLKERYNQLLNEMSVKSPLFYVDYGISTYSKFKRTPPTLWAFEAQKFGKIIYGEDVISCMIPVTLQNLDYGSLNELIIVRLWNMLIHLNNNIIYKKATEYEKFIAKFCYSRNILDILTILLPNYGVLIGGYRNRLNYFIDNFKGTRWDKYRDIFIKATKLKLDLKDELSLEEAKRVFFDGYVEFLFDIAKINGKVGIRDLEGYFHAIKKSGIFSERATRKLRRKYIEIRMWGKYYKFNWWKIKDVLSDTLRYHLLYILIYMHAVLLDDVRREDKVEFLKKAILHFNMISSERFYYDRRKSLEDNWLNLRNGLLSFMMEWFYIRTNISKEEIVNNYFKWEERRCEKLSDSIH